jgi:hypothetical protein
MKQVFAILLVFTPMLFGKVQRLDAWSVVAGAIVVIVLVAFLTGWLVTHKRLSKPVTTGANHSGIKSRT